MSLTLSTVYAKIVSFVKREYGLIKLSRLQAAVGADYSATVATAQKIIAEAQAEYAKGVAEVETLAKSELASLHGLLSHIESTASALLAKGVLSGAHATSAATVVTAASSASTPIAVTVADAAAKA